MLQEIEILNLELIDYNYPKFTIKTLVSKGTYIRTLGVDIAKRLGKFCCLTDLQRSGIGSINLKESIDINTLKSLDNVSKMKYVKRVEEILRKFPKVSLSSSEVKKFQNGSFVRVKDQKIHNECFVFFFKKNSQASARSSTYINSLFGVPSPQILIILDFRFNAK